MPFDSLPVTNPVIEALREGEVHRSNMSKLGADGRPVLRDDGKILKGPNFRPADVSPYLQPARPVAAISEEGWS